MIIFTSVYFTNSIASSCKPYNSDHVIEAVCYVCTKWMCLVLSVCTKVVYLVAIVSVSKEFHSRIPLILLLNYLEITYNTESGITFVGLFKVST